MTLGVLSRHLVAEGVSAPSGSLLLKGAVHRASGEASEAVAVTSRSGGRLIAVAVDRRRQRTVVELNSASIEAVVEVLSAFASAGVSVARAAHDVAELDATSFAVPQADTDEEDEDTAKDDGKSDGELDTGGELSLGIFGSGRVLDNDWKLVRDFRDVLVTEGTREERNSYVGGLVLVQLLGDGESEETESGGDFFVLLQEDPCSVVLVAVIEADRDIWGCHILLCFASLVEVDGVPSN